MDPNNLSELEKKYQEVQSRINQGYALKKDFSDKAAKIAIKNASSPEFTEKIKRHLIECGQSGNSNACISAAYINAKEAGVPFNKKYTSNEAFKFASLKGEEPWVIDNNLQQAIPGGHLYFFNRTQKGLPGRTYHTYSISDVVKGANGAPQKIRVSGVAGNPNDRVDKWIYPNDYDGNLMVGYPNFVNQKDVATRDSLANELKKINPNFGNPNFKPRYTDFAQVESLIKTNRHPNNLSDVLTKNPSDFYKGVIEKQSDLMVKYNLSNEEFTTLLSLLSGIGEQESKHGNSLRYHFKDYATQTYGQLFRGILKGNWYEVKNAGNKEHHSQGPWQIKPVWAPKDVDVNSAIGAFEVLASRYKNEIPSQYRGTDYGYGMLVNKWKGIKAPLNEYVKSVLDKAEHYQPKINGVNVQPINYDRFKKSLPVDKGSMKSPFGNNPIQSFNSGGDIPIVQNGKKISLDEFRPKFANSNENIQQEILKNDQIKNSELYQKQLVLKAINEAEEANRKKYEPSQAVKNTKAVLAAAQLVNPKNLYLKAVNTGGDLYTAMRYGIDGQYDKAKEDLIQAGINWLPFLKGKPGMKQGTYNLSKLDNLINLGISGTQKGSDVKTITEVKQTGGKIKTDPNGYWNKDNRGKLGWEIIEDDGLPIVQNGKKISLDEFRPKFANSNENNPPIRTFQTGGGVCNCTGKIKLK